ncbi:MAG: lipase family protein, partial [Campylobacterota bacterium]|nr:lipase family protein [Campylobacterota bacterium]
VLNSVSKQVPANNKEFKVDGYNSQMALKMAYLADGVFWDDFGKKAFKSQGIVYDGHIDKKEGLVNLQYAYGHKGNLNSNMDIYISIRGSKEEMDWVTDANFVADKYDEKIDDKIEVHSGFLQSANLLISQEKLSKIAGSTLSKLIALNASKKRSDNFYITGHSLGGAVATIYATKLLDRGIKRDKLHVYTFGAPPISMDEGDVKKSIKSGSITAVASSALDSSLSTKSEKGVNFYIDRYKNRIDIYRVYDKNDLIPKLLPPARHLGKEVQFGDKLSAKELIDMDKMWKIHWMNNYIKQIKKGKPQDPNSGNSVASQLMGLF